MKAHSFYPGPGLHSGLFEKKAGQHSDLFVKRLANTAV
jgi:hypothetical protein